MEKEINHNRELQEIVSPHFVVLAGPSGIGKSTILQEITQRDPRIVLNPVYTTRPSRGSDPGRINISRSDIEDLKKSPDLLTCEEAYGNSYAIVRSDVKRQLERNRIPIQDYSFSGVANLREKIGDIPLLVVGLLPGNEEELINRLKNENNSERIPEVLRELELVRSAREGIDILVTNNTISQTTEEVLYTIYRRACS